jgi:hypothetical protein
MAESKPSPVALIGLAAILVVGGGAVYFLYFASSGEAFVNGSVTSEGKPVAYAKLAFFRTDKPDSPVLSQSDEQGRYKIVGNHGGGIAPGKYCVTATKMALKDGTMPAGESLTQAIAKGLLVNHLAKEYEDDKASPLQFEIRSGSQTIPLEVKPKR